MRLNVLVLIGLFPLSVTAQPIPGGSRPSSAVHVTAQKKTVFIGGTRGFLQLAQPSVANPLIATGRIGLYQHAVAMALLMPAQLSNLLGIWAPTGANPKGGGQGVAEITLGGSSGTPTSGSNATAHFGTSGQYPIEAVMGPVAGSAAGTYSAPAGSAHPGHAYGDYPNDTDLAEGKSAITLARQYGVKTVSYGFTPNAGTEDLDDPYATSGFWAADRALARLGGGGGVDAPPSFFFSRDAAYQSLIAQKIRWLNSQRLLSTFIVSPFSSKPDSAGNVGPQAYDGRFFENTKRLFVYLKAAQALPSQWMVENYAAPQLPTATANTADGSAEGLDTVALWLVNATSAAAHPAPHQAHSRRVVAQRH